MWWIEAKELRGPKTQNKKTGKKIKQNSLFIWNFTHTLTEVLTLKHPLAPPPPPSNIHVPPIEHHDPDTCIHHYHPLPAPLDDPLLSVTQSPWSQHSLMPQSLCTTPKQNKSWSPNDTDHDSMVGVLLAHITDELNKMLRVTIGNINTNVVDIWNCLQNLAQLGKVTIANSRTGRTQLSPHI